MGKGTEQILELLVFTGNKREEALRHIPWITSSTVNQFPLEENYFKGTEQDIRYEKFQEVTKKNHCIKDRQEPLNEGRSCLVLEGPRNLTPYL